jgi:hypothetical protein
MAVEEVHCRHHALGFARRRIGQRRRREGGLGRPAMGTPVRHGAPPHGGGRVRPGVGNNVFTRKEEDFL